MKLQCLVAIVCIAVLDNAPADAKVLKKRAKHGVESWTSAVDDAGAYTPSSNNNLLNGPLSKVRAAAIANPLNIPNLLSSIFNLVEVAIDTEGNYYYAPISAGLIDMFSSINQLASDALSNAPAATLNVDAQKVVNAAYVISCPGNCDQFSAIPSVLQLLADMKKNSTSIIIKDVLFLPQAAIASFSPNFAAPVLGPTLTLLRDVNTLINVCLSRTSIGFSSALQAVITDADNIGDSLV